MFLLHQLELHDPNTAGLSEPGLTLKWTRRLEPLALHAEKQSRRYRTAQIFMKSIITAAESSPNPLQILTFRGVLGV